MIPNRKISAYLHVPFCQSKCDYCDFNSYSGMEERVEEYFDALFREISLSSLYYSASGCDMLQNRQLSSVFIGGGTPTYVPSKYIVKSLHLLREMIGFSDACEITLECNPGTLTTEKARDYLAAGVNRISVGLQCYCDFVLQNIGRKHTCEEFDKTMSILLDVGFSNINVDLIVGLPYQTTEHVIQSVKEAILRKVSHVSVYSLSVEPDTRIDTLYAEKPFLFPSDETEREMYNVARELLQSYGFIHYEISNFAKPGKECIHNVLCWQLHEYLGFGSGAHSYIEEARFHNKTEIVGYCNSFTKTHPYDTHAIREDFTRIEQDESEKEFFVLGFRLLKGINECDFEERFQKPMSSYYPILKRLIRQDLLTKTGDCFCLTEKGIHYANQIFMAFI